MEIPDIKTCVSAATIHIKVTTAKSNDDISGTWKYTYKIK